IVIAASACWSQGTQGTSAPPALGVREPPPQAAPPPSEGAPPAREEKPGLINEMGKLFEKSLSILPKIKSPSETIDDLNARAKDAGKAWPTLPNRPPWGRGARCGRLPSTALPDLKGGAGPPCPSQG